MIDSKKKRKDSKKAIKTTQKPTAKKVDVVLRSNDKLVIESKKNIILIKIWDGNIEDNDIISIYLNDKIFKENIILKKKKRSLSVPMIKGDSKLKIVAINEGDSGINTVNFSIKNTHNSKEFVSKLKTEESFVIELKAI